MLQTLRAMTNHDVFQNVTYGDNFVYIKKRSNIIIDLYKIYQVFKRVISTLNNKKLTKNHNVPWCAITRLGIRHT